MAEAAEAMSPGRRKGSFRDPPQGMPPDDEDPLPPPTLTPMQHWATAGRRVVRQSLVALGLQPEEEAAAQRAAPPAVADEAAEEADTLMGSIVRVWRRSIFGQPPLQPTEKQQQQQINERVARARTANQVKRGLWRQSLIMLGIQKETEEEAAERVSADGPKAQAGPRKSIFGKWMQTISEAMPGLSPGARGKLPPGMPPTEGEPSPGLSPGARAKPPPGMPPTL
jgi:hypothetical protein